MLLPRQKTPNLTVETVAHGTFDLSQQTHERGTVVCFYRGLHCPICATYVKELVRLAPEFAKRGVGVIALSSDTADRAADFADRAEAQSIPVGFGLPLSQAREWGLYVSTGRGKTSIGIEEPALFSEPGLFMISPDQSLYYGSVQTMPFVRPHFSELLSALDFAIEKNYPARGEYTGAV